MGTNDFDSLDYPWPEKNDRLLSGRGGRLTEADVGNWSRNFSAFVWSFTNAADTIVDAIIEGRQRGDRVASPLVYLYRHAVELAFKECLFHAAECLNEPFVSPTHHKLKGYKGLLFRQLIKLGISTEDESTAAFSEVLDDLNKLDPTGDAFRYPTDSRGALQELPLTHFDAVDLRHGVMKLLNFLDCVDQEIKTQVDARQYIRK